MMNRTKPTSVNYRLVATILAVSLVIGAAGVQAASAPVKKNLIKASDVSSSHAYAFRKCRSLQAKAFNPSSKKKKLIILGDSQGCDLLNGLVENHYLRDYQIRFRFIPYPCQRIPGDHVSKYISRKNQHFCLKSDRADSLQNAREQIQKADVIIYSALWKAEVAQKLPQIMSYLGIKKRQKQIVIGNKFFGNIQIHDYIHMSDRELRKLRINVGTKATRINDILRKRIGRRTMFIDPQKLVCGNSTTCPAFTKRLKLISYDGRHLTKEGARYYGKVLFQKTDLHKVL